MKTAYLVRKNIWMDDGERKVARKIGRELEKQLEARVGATDSVAAVVAYCAGCAVALLGRVQARYVEALVSGGDVAGLQLALAAAQDGALRAGRALDALQAARLWHETAAWDGYGAAAQAALADAGSAMDALALDDAAQLATRHAARAARTQPVESSASSEAKTLADEPPVAPGEASQTGVARVAPHPCPPEGTGHSSADDCTAPNAPDVGADDACVPEVSQQANVPRWVRRQQQHAAQRKARQAARAEDRRVARGRVAL